MGENFEQSFLKYREGVNFVWPSYSYYVATDFNERFEDVHNNYHKIAARSDSEVHHFTFAECGEKCVKYLAPSI